MGLDLTVVPVKHGDRSSWWLGYERLSFDRDYSLFEQIESRGRQELDEPIEKVCNPQPIPDDFKFEWYGDEGLIEETTDSYGGHLTFIRAFEVHKLDATKSSKWNQAVIEFLKLLHPQTPIVLWWH